MKLSLLLVMWASTFGLASCQNDTATSISGREVTRDEQGYTFISRYKIIKGARHTRTVVLDESGKLFGIANFVNGIIDGDQYYFNQSEKPTRLTQYKNGEPNGRQYNFRGNGRIATIREKKGDLLRGWSYEFDDQSNIVEKSHYVVVNGQSVLNGAVDYNIKGEVIRGVGLAGISFVADTNQTQIPDSVYLTAQILFPLRKNCVLGLGDYDEEFRLKNKSTQGFIKGKGHTISAWVHVHDTVSGYIRGIISDVDSIKRKRDKMWETEGRPIYFEVRIK